MQIVKSLIDSFGDIQADDLVAAAKNQNARLEDTQ